MRHRCDIAVRERIAHVAGEAGANRRVIDDRALGVLAARARTRIGAALAHAGQIAATVLVDGALGLAVGRRSDVSSQTGAGGRAVQLATL